MRSRVKTRDCRLIVQVKLPFQTSVKEAELSDFSRRSLRGFLRPEKIRKHKIEYSGPVGISLYERLQKPISKYDFFFVIEQVVNATQKLQKNGLLTDFVVWDLKNVFINEVTKEMHFIYLPLTQIKEDTDILEFIRTIIYTSHPMESQESNAISLFAYFLNEFPIYKAEEIENYIYKMEKSVVNTIKSHSSVPRGSITDWKQAGYEDCMDDENGSCVLEDEETGLLEE